MVSSKSVVERYKAACSQGGEKTAAEEDNSKKVVKWLAPKRKAVIQKHIKAMSAELDELWDQAKKEFDNNYNEPVVHRELRKLETPLRESLQ